MVRTALLSRRGLGGYDVLTDSFGHSRCKECGLKAPTCQFFTTQQK